MEEDSQDGLRFNKCIEETIYISGESAHLDLHTRVLVVQVQDGEDLRFICSAIDPSLGRAYLGTFKSSRTMTESTCPVQCEGHPIIGHL